MTNCQLQYCIASQENNVYFADSNLSLAELQQKYDDFREKLAVARRKGSPSDTAAKNESAEALCLVLKQLGDNQAWQK